MIGLDTNMLVRLCLDDDPTQAQAVERLLDSGELCSAPTTVMLELVWVLQNKGFQRTDVAQALMRLCALPNFVAQDMEALENAVESYAQGLDFADALHLALSQAFDALYTFDRAFAKKAKQYRLKPPVVMA